MLLFGAVGGAVDYSRWLSAQIKVRDALDSAVLAAGRTLLIEGADGQTQALATAKTYFEKMKPSWLPQAATTFGISDNRSIVSGTTDWHIETPFLHIIGLPQLKIKASAEAEVAGGGDSEHNVEISMMLDITGSMAGTKIEDLKTAAKDLVDIVVWSDQSTYTSKVAIVPFSTGVNVGSAAPAMTGMPPTSGGWKLIPCVTARLGTEEFSDAAPADGSYVGAWRGGNNIADVGNYNSTGICEEPLSTILPLTSNKTVLKDHIDSFGTYGITAGAAGTAWAWYMISPKWANVWPDLSRPAPYSDITTLGPSGQPKLNKIVILMSDGEYNTYAGEITSSSVVSEKAKKLCENIKATGTVIYTVGFLLTADVAIDVLKACASRDPNDPVDSPSYFYATSSGMELKSAFRDIALKVASLRLRQ